MGALRVWDGTAWQTVSQQGPAGTAPVTSVDARTGAVTLSDLYVAKPNVHGPSHAPGGADMIPGITDGSYTTWAPRFATDGGSEAGMTPGVGGGISASYRMIAPYTMSYFLRLQWGSSGGNGGGTGGIMFSLPSGYTISLGGQIQYSNCFVWCGDNTFYYCGLVDMYPGEIWLRPRCPVSDPVNRYVGSQVRVSTASMFPAAWYPNGGCQLWGVLQVNQRM